MVKPVTQAVLESGLMDKDTVAQFKRWGYLPDVEVPEEVLDLDKAAAKIRMALESGDVVEVRDTDLDIISKYLTNREKARLYLPNPEDEKKTVSIAVDYCKSKMGEYAIPWMSESIRDLLLDDRAYLKLKTGEKIYFSDTRELYYDNQKAFVVCTPAGE